MSELKEVITEIATDQAKVIQFPPRKGKQIPELTDSELVEEINSVTSICNAFSRATTNRLKAEASRAIHETMLMSSAVNQLSDLWFNYRKALFVELKRRTSALREASMGF